MFWGFGFGYLCVFVVLFAWVWGLSALAVKGPRAEDGAGSQV